MLKGLNNDSEHLGYAVLHSGALMPGGQGKFGSSLEDGWSQSAMAFSEGIGHLPHRDPSVAAQLCTQAPH